MSSKSLMPWLMLVAAGVCLRSGISSISPVLEDIRQSLQVDSAWLGLLTAIPVICMGVLSPLGYKLERRLGMRQAMAGALLLLIIGLLLRLDSGNFALLLLTAGCVGVADAIIRPLLSGFIKQRFPQRVALAMSIYSASMGLGAAAAAWGTPLAAEISGHGWRGGLAVWALPALLALLVWCRGAMHSGQPDSAVEAAGHGLSQRHIISFTLFFAFQAGINYSILAWLPSFFSQQGLSAHLAGLLLAGCVVTQMLTSLLFSLIIQRLAISHRRAPLLFSLLTLFGVMALFLPVSPWLAVVLMGIGTGGLFPMALIIPLDFTASKTAATQLSGITQSGGYLLGGMMPWLTGLLAEALGVIIGLKVFLLFCTLSIMVISLLIARAYRQRQDGERAM